MDEHRARAELLVDGIEHQALLGILRGHFDEAAVDPGDRHGVVEKDSSRVAGFNARGLQAGFRKHGHLRFDGDVEGFEQRPQVACFSVEFQLDFAVFHFALQIGHDVAGRMLGEVMVIDGRVVERGRKFVVQFRKA